MIKYKFVEYNKNYPKLFEKEKARLKKILVDSKIEHVGSTSVKGLGGKGIIDILICVPKKDIAKIKYKLINSNYKFSLTGGDTDRLFFYKDYGFFNKRRVHLHLTYFKSKISKEAILFRDKLKESLKLRKEYSELKRKAILLGKEKQEYRNFKEKFIKKVVKIK
jgi:GrpB-like predicted nucleotidyltransferase (UPF0157 family)